MREANELFADRLERSSQFGVVVGIEEVGLRRGALLQPFLRRLVPQIEGYRHHQDFAILDTPAKLFQVVLAIGDGTAVARTPAVRRLPPVGQQYDRLGSQWQQYQKSGGKPEDFNWGERAAAGNQNYSYRTVSPEEFEELFGSGGGFSDFFTNLFGGGSRTQNNGDRGGQKFYRQARPRHGGDLEHSLQVSLIEAYRGTKRPGPPEIDVLFCEHRSNVYETFSAIAATRFKM